VGDIFQEKREEEGKRIEGPDRGRLVQFRIFARSATTIPASVCTTRLSRRRKRGKLPLCLFSITFVCFFVCFLSSLLVWLFSISFVCLFIFYRFCLLGCFLGFFCIPFLSALFGEILLLEHHDSLDEIFIR